MVEIYLLVKLEIGKNTWIFILIFIRIVRAFMKGEL